jgi:hypothetical protein
VSGKISVRPSARGKAKTYRLKPVADRAVATGARLKFALKIPRKARVAITKALRNRAKATSRFTVNARDAAGNNAPALVRTVRFKR